MIILPSKSADTAPTLVRPQDDQLAMLQPSGSDARGVVLDQVTYSEKGAVLLRGRARPGRVVRVYGDGRLMRTVRTLDTGTWTASAPPAPAEALSLLRFDEVDGDGAVTSRIEVPFTYSSVSPQVVREREVVIQRGDNLWRIAEQTYGDGIRYSLIYGANSGLIRDPDLIYPDQVFTIPELVDAEE